VAILVGVALLRVRSRRFVPGLIFLAAGVLMVGFAPDVFVTRFNAVLDGTDSTGSGRLRIWTTGLEALKDNWAIGSGLGTFQAAYNVHVPAALSKTTPVAHNLYLSTAVELGVLGLILVLLTLAFHFRASLVCRRPAIDLISIEAGCLAVMVAGAFGEYLYAKSFWLPWMLLVWSVRLHTESQGSELSQPAPVRSGHHLSGSGGRMRHASPRDTSPVPSQ
jgi:O-antigen ligase